MEQLKRLKQITLDDVIFFALVMFAIGSCISGHLGNHSEKVVIVLCAIRLLKGDIPMERFRVAKGLAFALLFFYGTMLISALWSGNFAVAVEFYPLLGWAFETLLVFCVLLCANRAKRVEILCIAFFLSMLAMDCWMMYMFFRGVHRPPGPLNHILTTSALYAIQISALAYFSVNDKVGSRVRNVCRGMLMVAIAGAYVIGTRGLWLILPFALLVIVTYGGRGWKYSLRFVTICVLFIIGFAMLAPPSIRNRISYSALHDTSVTARLGLYDGATKMFFDHPVLGVGMSNFQKYWKEQYCPSDKPQWRVFRHPHNIYFLFLTEGGLVGMAGYATAFGYILLWSWRRRYTRQGILLFGVTLSLLLYGLSDDLWENHELTRVFWFVVGMAFAEEAISSKKQQAEEFGDKNPVD